MRYRHRRKTVRRSPEFHRSTCSRRLVDEQRIAGELERLMPMRLQAERARFANGCLREIHLTRHCARTPVGRVRRHGFQCSGNDGVDMRVPDRPRRTGARRIEQTIQTMSNEARTPLRNGRLCNSPFRRNGFIVDAFSTRQHDPGSQCQRLRCLATQRERMSCSRSDSLNTSSALGLPLIATSWSTCLPHTLLQAANNLMNF